MTFRYSNAVQPSPVTDWAKKEILDQIKALEQKQAETNALIAALKAKAESMPDAGPPTQSPAAAPKNK